MIEFIEKEPFPSIVIVTKRILLYPNYMVKDGREYFLFNRSECETPHDAEINEGYKKQLIDNGGKYFTFYGYKRNPLEMLKIAAERKHTFAQPKNVLEVVKEENGYANFHGNFKEVSAAFHYRIYDQDLIQAIKQAAERFIKKDWNKVIEICNEGLKVQS